MVQEMHNIQDAKSSFDLVKKSFAKRLLTSASNHSHVTSSSIPSSSASKYDTSIIFVHGWALPVRSKYRYNSQQKSCELFEDGEVTGKKTSPEDAHTMMKQKFDDEKFLQSETDSEFVFKMG